MNRNVAALISCVLFALCAASCARNDSTQNSSSTAPNSQETSTQTAPASQIVRAEVSPVEINSGAGAEVVVRLSVAGGYHINANPATYPYLIPTELTINPSNVLVVGQSKYPQAQTKKFDFDPKPLAVYEGEIEIRLTLFAPHGTPQTLSLPGKLRVQPCDDKQCFPPRTIEISIPVTIR